MEAEDRTCLSPGLRKILNQSHLDSLPQSFKAAQMWKVARESPIFKIRHDSLPNVGKHWQKTPKSDKNLWSNKSHSDHSSLENMIDDREAERDNLEEDYKNVGKLIENLRTIADSISAKYEKTKADKKKQLKLRAQEEVIANIANLGSVPAGKDTEVTCFELARPDNLAIEIQNRYRIQPSAVESTQFFLESERLLRSGASAPGIQWSDPSVRSPISPTSATSPASPTSPTSTTLESPFERYVDI